MIKIKKFCKVIIAVLTQRNVRCLGPPPVYITRAGGIYSMEPYFAINTSPTPCAFLKAEVELMAILTKRLVLVSTMNLQCFH